MDAEFGELRKRLTRWDISQLEPRVDQRGGPPLSVRATAAVTGASPATVSRDARAAVAEVSHDETPAPLTSPLTVTGMDGKRYPRARVAVVEPELSVTRQGRVTMVNPSRASRQVARVRVVEPEPSVTQVARVRGLNRSRASRRWLGSRWLNPSRASRRCRVTVVEPEPSVTQVARVTVVEPEPSVTQVARVTVVEPEPSVTQVARVTVISAPFGGLLPPGDKDEEPVVIEGPSEENIRLALDAIEEIRLAVGKLKRLPSRTMREAISLEEWTRLTVWYW